MSIEKEVAHEIISQSVDGIRSKTVDESIEYRDMGGMLLAVLSDAASKLAAKAKLRYQTSVLTPLLAHNRVKAHKVRDSIADQHVSD